jgi:hypothetical protein
MSVEEGKSYKFFTDDEIRLWETAALWAGGRYTYHRLKALAKK